MHACYIKCLTVSIKANYTSVQIRKPTLSSSTVNSILGTWSGWRRSMSVAGTWRQHALMTLSAVYAVRQADFPQSQRRAVPSRDDDTTLRPRSTIAVSSTPATCSNNSNFSQQNCRLSTVAHAVNDVKKDESSFMVGLWTEMILASRQTSYNWR